MKVPIIRSIAKWLVAVMLATMLVAMGASCSRGSGTNLSLTDKFAGSAATVKSGDPIASSSPAVIDVVEKALAALTETDVDAVDASIAAIEEAGLLAEAEASLSAALAAADAAGTPAPGLHLALAAVYGRKGLAGKAYAAVKAAETAATAPGVRFSLAAIHGRKALLAPDAANGVFAVSVSCDHRGAAVALDGADAVPDPVVF